jgi:hypothetical protein
MSKMKMFPGALAGVMLFATLTCGVGCAPAQAARSVGPPPMVLEEEERNLNILTRIERQQKRIDTGVRKRQLTRRERNMLSDNLNWISKRYRKAKKDGWLSKEEEQRLHWLLNENSKMIRDTRRNPVWRLY